MVKPARLRARIAQTLDIEFRPDFSFIGSALQHALQGRLADEDSESKKAVVVGQSLWLAEVLGLKTTRILHLPYPDFTIENLALLSDEYDFVIADRVLYRCQSAGDAARETVRVLRPGGWFVHTASLLDFRSMPSVSWSMLGPRRLRALFPHTANASAGSWHTLVSWIVAQKATDAPAIAPSVATRVARRPFYGFRPRPAKFGVMTMVRNEAPYLLEWIAHYRVLGFSQITIYDNCSNDASAEILLPLSRAGIINACHWRDRPTFKQTRAYRDALRRLRPFVEWCLFIDLDEFLVLDPGLSLDDLASKAPDVSGVGIQWRQYGSAGQRNRETGLTIERFRMTQPRNRRVLKSLVRLRDVERMGIHTPKQIKGRVIDVAGRTIEDLLVNALPWVADGPARLNHYYNRSWEEFECKRARGRGAVTGEFRDAKTFDRYGPGKVELLDTLRYAPAVKEEIARLRKIVDAG